MPRSLHTATRCATRRRVLGGKATGCHGCFRKYSRSKQSCCSFVKLRWLRRTNGACRRYLCCVSLLHPVLWECGCAGERVGALHIYIGPVYRILAQPWDDASLCVPALRALSGRLARQASVFLALLAILICIPVGPLRTCRAENLSGVQGQLISSASSLTATQSQLFARAQALHVSNVQMQSEKASLESDMANLESQMAIIDDQRTLHPCLYVLYDLLSLSVT